MKYKLLRIDVPLNTLTCTGYAERDERAYYTGKVDGKKLDLVLRQAAYLGDPKEMQGLWAVALVGWDDRTVEMGGPEHVNGHKPHTKISINSLHTMRTGEAIAFAMRNKMRAYDLTEALEGADK